jgi:hypothetical protein
MVRGRIFWLRTKDAVPARALTPLAGNAQCSSHIVILERGTRIVGPHPVTPHPASRRRSAQRQRAVTSIAAPLLPLRHPRVRRGSKQTSTSPVLNAAAVLRRATDAAPCLVSRLRRNDVCGRMSAKTRFVKVVIRLGIGERNLALCCSLAARTRYRLAR